MLVDNIHFNAIEKPSGFMVSWTKPRNHETWRLLDIPEMNWMKPWNLMTSRCPRDGVDETTKPRNHETWRLLDVPEMDWVKPRNHETMKPDGLSMSQRWIGWNRETMKPDIFSMSQRWIGWNHETTKPWNLSASCSPRDGVDVTMKPQNHETYCHFNVSEMECTKPWNHATTKPWNLSASCCPPMEIIHETMKPWNQSLTWLHLLVLGTLPTCHLP